MLFGGLDMYTGKTLTRTNAWQYINFKPNKTNLCEISYKLYTPI